MYVYRYESFKIITGWVVFITYERHNCLKLNPEWTYKIRIDMSLTYLLDSRQSFQN